jgi:hypothetical protein
MSVFVQYDFSSSSNITDLANSINQAIGCNLQLKGESTDFFECLFLDVVLSLVEQDSNRGTKATQTSHQYQLVSKTWMNTTDTRALQVPAISMIAYVLFFRMGITGSLLLEDEHILATYEARKDIKNRLSLFDSVSTKIVSFPQHFVDLLAQKGGQEF